MKFIICLCLLFSLNLIGQKKTNCKEIYKSGIYSYTINDTEVKVFKSNTEQIEKYKNSMRTFLVYSEIRWIDSQKFHLIIKGMNNNTTNFGIGDTITIKMVGCSEREIEMETYSNKEIEPLSSFKLINEKRISSSEMNKYISVYKNILLGNSSNNRKED